MFCWKCGKELPEEAKFCPGCGAQINGEKRTISAEIIAPHTDNIKRGLGALKDCKGLFLGTIAGIIMALFFLGGEMFEVTFEFFTTFSERFTMFEENESLKTVFILAHIAVLTLMVMPLLTGKTWGSFHLYPAAVIPLINVVVFFIIMLSVKEQMAESMMMDAVQAKVALTANGWLFLLVNIATELLAINTKNVLVEEQKEAREKEIKEEAEEEEPVERAYRCAFCDMEGPYEGDCPRCGSASKRYIK